MQAFQDIAKLPRAVWLLCIAMLINRIGTMAILFLSLYVTKHLGQPPTVAGLVMGVYGGTALVVTPFSGWISDRFGAVWVVTLSLLFSGAVLLLFPFVHALPALLALTFLFALATEGFRPAALAVLGSLVPQERMAAAHALYRLASNLGMSVGPVVGGFLALVSYRMIFWVDGVTSLLAFSFLIFSGFWGQAARAHHAQKAQHKHLPKRLALKDKSFVCFLLANVPLSLVVYQLTSTYPLFVVNELGYKESVYGMLSLVNTLVIVFCEIPLVARLKSFSLRSLLSVGALCNGLGFAILACSGHLGGLVVSMLLITLGEMLQSCTAMTYVNHLAPARQRGEYLGYYTMMFSLAFMLAPSLGTMVMQTWGSAVLWACAFLMCLFSVALYWKTMDRKILLSSRDLKNLSEPTASLPSMP